MAVKITLKAARVNANLSRSAAAQQLGISAQTLKNWELGKTFPRQPDIERICSLYQMPLNDLNFCPRD